MRLRSVAVAAIMWMQVSAALALDAPEVDAKKYPQDTPRNALGSIVKSMDAKDYAYWVTWLIVPPERDRILQKYKNLDGLIAVNAEPKRADAIKAQSEVMKKLLASDAMTEGEAGGVKWARFTLAEVVLQVEKQPDGRWVMNTKIRNAKQAEAWERGELKSEPAPEPPKETK